MNAPHLDTGSTAPDPPNLLPSAKVQDFRTVQQQRSPQAIPRSPSGPSRDLHRLENQPEQAGRTQAGPNHARINDWIEQAYPQPSNPKSKSINDWIEQAYPRQGNPQAKAKEFVSACIWCACESCCIVKHAIAMPR